VGALIALSPVGKVSGAHINPAVTLAFRLMGKLDFRVAVGYVLSQLAGSILGSLPLLAWGSLGRSLAFGATPGSGGHIWTMAWLVDLLGGPYHRDNLSNVSLQLPGKAN
jgi:aquaporin Z